MAKRNRKMWKAVAKIPFNSLTWQSQFGQYDASGQPGIELRRYVENVKDYVTDPENWSGQFPIDCVLYRDDTGALRGILNYYPVGTPQLVEKPGNINMFVDPTYRRQGIGMQLLDAAIEAWSIDLTKQLYSIDGAALVNSYLRKRKLVLR